MCQHPGRDDQSRLGAVPSWSLRHTEFTNLCYHKEVQRESFLRIYQFWHRWWSKLAHFHSPGSQDSCRLSGTFSWFWCLGQLAPSLLVPGRCSESQPHHKTMQKFDCHPEKKDIRLPCPIFRVIMFRKNQNLN